LEITVATVALICQPFDFGAPEHAVVRLPDIRASAAEAEGLEAHRLQCNVACKNHQVGPGDLAAVFLLDRPQKPARLVEVGVVRPTVGWRKALLTGPRAATAV